MDPGKQAADDTEAYPGQRSRNNPDHRVRLYDGLDKPIEMHTVIYQRGDDMAMKIAITRLKGKEGKDQEYCHKYGHECIIVSPLAAKVNRDRVSAFVKAAENDEFDCIFFTSALPAQIIAPLLHTLAQGNCNRPTDYPYP